MRFVGLLLLLDLVCGSDFIGPAKAVLQRIEKCSEDKLGYKMEFKIHRINRTHQGIDGDIYVPFPMDDEADINITIAKWGDGGWKPHFYDHYDPSSCKFFLKYAEGDFTTIMNSIKMPAKCPADAGAYKIDNFVYNGDLSVPMMYGKFMVDAVLSRKGEMYACLKVFVNSEPKKVSLLK